MRLRIRSQTQLEEYLLHVRLNGALGDEEAVSDSLVREAFADEAQDFSLALGELGERIFASAPADELGDDRRIDHRLAVTQAPECVDENRRVAHTLFQEIPDPLAELTPREREVMELMAEGRSNNAIAAQMTVTERAVEKHVTSIFGKLGLAPAPEDHRRVLAVLAFLRA